MVAVDRREYLCFLDVMYDPPPAPKRHHKLSRRRQYHHRRKTLLIYLISLKLPAHHADPGCDQHRFPHRYRPGGESRLRAVGIGFACIPSCPCIHPHGRIWRLKSNEGNDLERMIRSAVPETTTLPLLPLRDVVVFPHMVIPLFVGARSRSRPLRPRWRLAKASCWSRKRTQRKTSLKPEDIYEIGRVMNILQC